MVQWALLRNRCRYRSRSDSHLHYIAVFQQVFALHQLAIENPFYAQNVKTAIALGQVRGAALVAVASQKCPLHEYSALEIKKAVTGYGRADKNQVKTMIKTLLNLQDAELGTDASDALAAAFCHLNTRMYQEQINASNGERSKT